MSQHLDDTVRQQNLALNRLTKRLGLRLYDVLVSMGWTPPPSNRTVLTFEQWLGEVGRSGLPRREHYSLEELSAMRTAWDASRAHLGTGS